MKQPFLRTIWLSGLTALFFLACPIDVATTKPATPPSENNPPLFKVRLNEIDANGKNDTDYIELINTDTAPVRLAADTWFLTDDSTTLKKFAIPETTLASGAFLGFTQKEENSFTFGVGKTETITLSYQKADGSLEIIDRFELKGSTTHSYGRIPDGSGTWVECILTKGAANQAGN